MSIAREIQLRLKYGNAIPVDSCRITREEFMNLCREIREDEATRARMPSVGAPPKPMAPAHEEKRAELAAQLYDSAQLSTLPGWCRKLLERAADELTKNEKDDDEIIHLGDWYVPAWAVRYADELSTYMAAHAQGGSWSIAGVQSVDHPQFSAALSEEQERLVAEATPGPYNCIESRRSNLWHIETSSEAPVAGLPICSVATGEANAHLVYEGINILWNRSKKTTAPSR